MRNEINLSTIIRSQWKPVSWSFIILNNDVSLENF